MKKAIILVFAVLSYYNFYSQKKQNFQLVSPNGKIEISIVLSDKITWAITDGKETVLNASPMSLTLNENEILGKNPMLLNSKKESIRASFETPFYKKKTVKDNYNQLLLNFKGDFSIEFRAFDEGVAYRFITKKKGDITVKSEEMVLNFDQDYNTLFLHSNPITKTKK